MSDQQRQSSSDPSQIHDPSVIINVGLNGFNKDLLVIADKLDDVQYNSDDPKKEVDNLLRFSCIKEARRKLQL